MKKIVFNLFALYFLMMLASCNSGKNENGTEENGFKNQTVTTALVVDSKYQSGQHPNEGVAWNQIVHRDIREKDVLHLPSF